MTEKRVRKNKIDGYLYGIFPEDLNPQGTIFGGVILNLIDRLGGILARRHSGRTCVTASVDRVDFIAPAKAGDILILNASINRVWGSSCEIGFKIFVEDWKTRNTKHLASAYLTFVSLDEDSKPTSMPRIIPRTKDEKRRYAEAEPRRELRLSARLAREKNVH